MASPPAVDRDLIVIGGSAGSLGVLQQILGALERDCPAALMICTHQPQTHPGRLPEILSRCGPLPLDNARDGEPIELGRVYVAPPDFHLLIERGRIRLSRGPKENRFRPAIDPLFRTAARVYGPQVIGVILSGLLDDGTLGMIRLKHFGGVAIVQDPAACDFPDMPAAVIRNVPCDFILKPGEIAGVIQRLLKEPSPPAQSPPTGARAMSPQPPPEISAGVDSETGDTADRGDNGLLSGHLPVNAASGLTCPQCGGAVWERNEHGLLTYRCHVGHAYSADSMAVEHDSHLESTLWEAVRMFQESAVLHRRMERRARETGQSDMATRYAERAADQEVRTELMRALLLGENGEGRESA